MKTRTPVVIVGAGGFGREVAWLAADIAEADRSVDVLGFIDDTATETAEGLPVIGTIADWARHPRRDVRLACAVGDPVNRRALVTRLADRGWEFATLVHPATRRSRFVEIGTGTVICAGCTLTTNIRIGAHSLLNLHCTVGHDAVLGEFTSAMPGVHISGDVTTGAGVYFGTGAAISNGVTVGEWTTVGAGAVVAADLPRAVIAVGVPAKAIKANSRAPNA